MSKEIKTNSDQNSEGTFTVPGAIEIKIIVGGLVIEGSLDVESGRIQESQNRGIPAVLELIAFHLDNRMIREIYEIVIVDVLEGALILLNAIEEETAPDGTVDREILEERFYDLSKGIIKAYLEPFNDSKAEGYTYVDEVEDEMLEMVFCHLCDILDGAGITEGDGAE